MNTCARVRMTRFIGLILTTVLIVSLIVPALVGAVAPTKTISYQPGATDTTGSVPVDTMTYAWDTPVTMKAPGTLARPGYTFAGWKLEPFEVPVDLNVFPCVAAPPADVGAMGTGEVDRFMFDYSAWVELYTIDMTLSSTRDFELFCRVRVDAGDEDLIGSARFPYMPAGEYLMLIWRPGFMPRYQVVVSDGLGGPLVEKFAKYHYGSTYLVDGSYSVWPIGSRSSVRDITDAYCLTAGDFNADLFHDNQDHSYFASIALASPNVGGGSTDFPLNGFWWRWSQDRDLPFWSSRDFATFDLNGNGDIDYDDYRLAQYNWSHASYSFFYGNVMPAYTYFEAQGMTSISALYLGFTDVATIRSRTEFNAPYAYAYDYEDLYQPGDVLRIPANMVLVAQWTKDQVPPGPGPQPKKPALPPAGESGGVAPTLPALFALGNLLVIMGRRRRNATEAPRVTVNKT